MNNNKLVNFGKYKNQPVEIMIEDTDYCNWFLTQTDMQNKYAWLYQIIQNAIKAEDTPEHNALQMRFMDEDYCIKVGNYFFELNKEKLSKGLQTSYVDCIKTEATIKKEIIEKLSEELTTIVLKQFKSLVFYNIESHEKIEFEEYRKYYFEKYNLEEYLSYFEKTGHTLGFKNSNDYKEKEKYIKNVINEIKDDIFSKLSPLLYFKKIEEIYEYSFYFSFEDKFVIKYCCNIEKSKTHIFDFSYETNEVYVCTIKINIYNEKPLETLPKLIKFIENDNNIKGISEPIFEKDNIDVMYNFFPSKKSFENNLGITLKIELKPTISEDYPSILRKAIKDKVNIVFCDNVTAKSGSIENIKKAFKNHQIDLIVSSDLNTLLIENKQNNVINEYLEKIDLISIDGKCDTDKVKSIIIELSQLYSFK